MCSDFIVEKTLKGEHQAITLSDVGSAFWAVIMKNIGLYSSKLTDV